MQVWSQQNQPTIHWTPELFHQARDWKRNHGMWYVLKPGCEWQIRVDLKQKPKFPLEISPTFLQPDIVLWSLARQWSWRDSDHGWTHTVKSGWKKLSRGRRRSTVSLLQHVQKQDGRQTPILWKPDAEALLENPPHTCWEALELADPGKRDLSETWGNQGSSRTAYQSFFTS